MLARRGFGLDNFYIYTIETRESEEYGERKRGEEVERGERKKIRTFIGGSLPS